VAPVATLGDVVGDPRNHNSRQSCHGPSLRNRFRRVNHHPAITYGAHKILSPKSLVGAPLHGTALSDGEEFLPEFGFLHNIQASPSVYNRRAAAGGDGRVARQSRTILSSGQERSKRDTRIGPPRTPEPQKRRGRGPSLLLPFFAFFVFFGGSALPLRPKAALGLLSSSAALWTSVLFVLLVTTTRCHALGGVSNLKHVIASEARQSPTTASEIASSLRSSQ
jgi:hypothetical protein